MTKRDSQAKLMDLKAQILLAHHACFTCIDQLLLKNSKLYTFKANPEKEDLIGIQL